MIVHICQMENGYLTLSGTESAKGLGLEEADAEAASDLEYNLQAGLSGGGLWVTGRLRLKLSLTCVRCLNKFPIDLELKEFAAQIPLDGRESIDLTPYVREDIFLALPPYPKCDSTGERECFAKFPQANDAPTEPEEAGQRSVWEILNELEIPDSNNQK
ncbi:MAG: DUF177 domain-containing protein [Chthoniobacterales bacterium]|nr:DUF177 domain-containing protein [Chthoniobacterales bacterium]MCX7713107.1 DUF177 domain-containing protein [Chthoniobacterales bacterium]